MTNDTEEHGGGSRDWGSRRDVLNGIATTGAAGMLGSLAGCSGGGDQPDGGGSGDDGGGSDGGGGGGSGTGTETEGDGGGSETLTLSYLTPDPTESTAHKEFYQKQMKQYGERRGNVKINLRSLGWGDLAQKLPSMAGTNRLPDVAMSGATGLQMWLTEDNLIDHGSFIEGSSDLPDKIHPTHVETMQYRDEWWSAGSQYTQATMAAVRPKFFKQVGIGGPSELETWTDFRRAVDSVDQQFSDVFAFEETGTPGDLESYWGEARTAYTDGTDPWMDVTDRGSYDDPFVKVGEEGRTDGMIKNCIDMGRTYSSPKVAARANEDVPPMMLTDRVASYCHELGRVGAWTAVKSDVSFGWDGDVQVIPIPKLDPNYGDEFGIPELAGESGQFGGNGWGFDIMHTGFDSTSSPEEAWALMDYVCRSEDFVLPYLGEVQTTAPGYMPLLPKLKDQYEIKQPQQALLELLDQHQNQFMPCGAQWDVPNTPTIRVEALNQTISQALAEQINPDETLQQIRTKITEALPG